MKATRPPLITVTWPWPLKKLDQLAKGRVRFQYSDPSKKAAFKKALQESEGLIVLLNHAVREDLLAGAPRLKALGTYSVGTNHIDPVACEKRGIRIINTPDVLTRSTAELALALLMAAARRLPEGEALCRKGKFKGWAPDLLLGLELKGRHAVLLGEGRIGRETAKLFHAIGMSIEFITRKDKAIDIRKKLGRAQVLSLHCPLTKETHHWLNARRLALLPQDSVVINTARGEIIDEKALIKSLASGKLFSAGLDVFEQEPLIPQALRKLPQVVLAPHLGSATRATRERMLEIVVEGTISALVN